MFILYWVCFVKLIIYLYYKRAMPETFKAWTKDKWKNSRPYDVNLDLDDDVLEWIDAELLGFLDDSKKWVSAIGKEILNKFNSDIDNTEKLLWNEVLLSDLWEYLSKNNIESNETDNIRYILQKSILDFLVDNKNSYTQINILLQWSEMLRLLESLWIKEFAINLNKIKLANVFYNKEIKWEYGEIISDNWPNFASIKKIIDSLKTQSNIPTSIRKPYVLKILNTTQDVNNTVWFFDYIKFNNRNNNNLDNKKLWTIRLMIDPTGEYTKEVFNNKKLYEFNKITSIDLDEDVNENIDKDTAKQVIKKFIEYVNKFDMNNNIDNFVFASNFKNKDAINLRSFVDKMPTKTLIEKKKKEKIIKFFEKWRTQLIKECMVHFRNNNNPDKKSAIHQFNENEIKFIQIYANVIWGDEISIDGSLWWTRTMQTKMNETNFWSSQIDIEAIENINFDNIKWRSKLSIASRRKVINDFFPIYMKPVIHGKFFYTSIIMTTLLSELYKGGKNIFMNLFEKIIKLELMENTSYKDFKMAEKKKIALKNEIENYKKTIKGIDKRNFEKAKDVKRQLFRELLSDEIYGKDRNAKRLEKKEWNKAYDYIAAIKLCRTDKYWILYDDGLEYEQSIIFSIIIGKAKEKNISVKTYMEQMNQLAQDNETTKKYEKLSTKQIKAFLNNPLYLKIKQQINENEKLNTEKSKLDTLVTLWSIYINHITNNNHVSMFSLNKAEVKKWGETQLYKLETIRKKLAIWITPEEIAKNYGVEAFDELIKILINDIFENEFKLRTDPYKNRRELPDDPEHISILALFSGISNETKKDDIKIKLQKIKELFLVKLDDWSEQTQASIVREILSIDEEDNIFKKFESHDKLLKHTKEDLLSEATIPRDNKLINSENEQIWESNINYIIDKVNKLNITDIFDYSKWNKWNIEKAVKYFPELDQEELKSALTESVGSLISLPNFLNETKIAKSYVENNMKYRAIAEAKQLQSMAISFSESFDYLNRLTQITDVNKDRTDQTESKLTIFSKELSEIWKRDLDKLTIEECIAYWKEIDNLINNENNKKIISENFSGDTVFNQVDNINHNLRCYHKIAYSEADSTDQVSFIVWNETVETSMKDEISHYREVQRTISFYQILKQVVICNAYKENEDEIEFAQKNGLLKWNQIALVYSKLTGAGKWLSPETINTINAITKEAIIQVWLFAISWWIWNIVEWAALRWFQLAFRWSRLAESITWFKILEKISTVKALRNKPLLWAFSKSINWAAFHGAHLVLNQFVSWSVFDSNFFEKLKPWEEYQDINWEKHSSWQWYLKSIAFISINWLFNTGAQSINQKLTISMARTKIASKAWELNTLWKTLSQTLNITWETTAMLTTEQLLWVLFGDRTEITAMSLLNTIEIVVWLKLAHKIKISNINKKLNDDILKEYKLDDAFVNIIESSKKINFTKDWKINLEFIVISKLWLQQTIKFNELTMQEYANLLLWKEYHKREAEYKKTHKNDPARINRIKLLDISEANKTELTTLFMLWTEIKNGKPYWVDEDMRLKYIETLWIKSKGQLELIESIHNSDMNFVLKQKIMSGEVVVTKEWENYIVRENGIDKTKERTETKKQNLLEMWLLSEKAKNNLIDKTESNLLVIDWVCMDIKLANSIKLVQNDELILTQSYLKNIEKQITSWKAKLITQGTQWEIYLLEIDVKTDNELGNNDTLKKKLLISKKIISWENSIEKANRILKEFNIQKRAYSIAKSLGLSVSVPKPYFASAFGDSVILVMEFVNWKTIYNKAIEEFLSQTYDKKLDFKFDDNATQAMLEYFLEWKFKKWDIEYDMQFHLRKDVKDNNIDYRMLESTIMWYLEEKAENLVFGIKRSESPDIRDLYIFIKALIDAGILHGNLWDNIRNIMIWKDNKMTYVIDFGMSETFEPWTKVKFNWSYITVEQYYWTARDFEIIETINKFIHDWKYKVEIWEWDNVSTITSKNILKILPNKTELEISTELNIYFSNPDVDIVDKKSECIWMTKKIFNDISNFLISWNIITQKDVWNNITKKHNILKYLIEKWESFTDKDREQPWIEIALTRKIDNNKEIEHIENIKLLKEIFWSEFIFDKENPTTKFFEQLHKKIYALKWDVLKKEQEKVLYGTKENNKKKSITTEFREWDSPLLPKLMNNIDWNAIVFNKDKQVIDINGERYYWIHSKWWIWEKKETIGTYNWKKRIRFSTFVEKNKYNPSLKGKIFVSSHGTNILNEEWLKIAKKMFYKKVFWDNTLLDNNNNIVSFNKNKQIYSINNKTYYWINSKWWLGNKSVKLKDWSIFKFSSFLINNRNHPSIKDNIFRAKPGINVLNSAWLKNIIELWLKEYPYNKPIIQTELLRLWFWILDWFDNALVKDKYDDLMKLHDKHRWKPLWLVWYIGMELSSNASVDNDAKIKITQETDRYIITTTNKFSDNDGSISDRIKSGVDSANTYTIEELKKLKFKLIKEEPKWNKEKKKWWWWNIWFIEMALLIKRSRQKLLLKNYNKIHNTEIRKVKDISNVETRDKFLSIINWPVFDFKIQNIDNEYKKIIISAIVQININTEQFSKPIARDKILTKLKIKNIDTENLTYLFTTGTELKNNRPVRIYESKRLEYIKTLWIISKWQLELIEAVHNLEIDWKLKKLILQGDIKNKSDFDSLSNKYVIEFSKIEDSIKLAEDNFFDTDIANLLVVDGVCGKMNKTEVITSKNILNTIKKKSKSEVIAELDNYFDNPKIALPLRKTQCILMTKSIFEDIAKLLISWNKITNENAWQNIINQRKIFKYIIKKWEKLSGKKRNVDWIKIVLSKKIKNWSEIDDIKMIKLLRDVFWNDFVFDRGMTTEKFILKLNKKIDKLKSEQLKVKTEKTWEIWKNETENNIDNNVDYKNIWTKEYIKENFGIDIKVEDEVTPTKKQKTPKSEDGNVFEKIKLQPEKIVAMFEVLDKLWISKEYLNTLKDKKWDSLIKLWKYKKDKMRQSYLYIPLRGTHGKISNKVILISLESGNKTFIISDPKNTIDIKILANKDVLKDQKNIKHINWNNNVNHWKTRVEVRLTMDHDSFVEKLVIPKKITPEYVDDLIERKKSILDKEIWWIISRKNFTGPSYNKLMKAFFWVNITSKKVLNNITEQQKQNRIILIKEILWINSLDGLSKIYNEHKISVIFGNNKNNLSLLWESLIKLWAFWNKYDKFTNDAVQTIFKRYLGNKEIKDVSFLILFKKFFKDTTRKEIKKNQRLVAKEILWIKQLSDVTSKLANGKNTRIFGVNKDRPVELWQKLIELWVFGEMYNNMESKYVVSIFKNNINSNLLISLEYRILLNKFFKNCSKEELIYNKKILVINILWITSFDKIDRKLIKNWKIKFIFWPQESKKILQDKFINLGLFDKDGNMTEDAKRLESIKNLWITSEWQLKLIEAVHNLEIDWRLKKLILQGDIKNKSDFDKLANKYNVKEYQEISSAIKIAKNNFFVEDIARKLVAKGICGKWVSTKGKINIKSILKSWDTVVFNKNKEAVVINDKTYYWINSARWIWSKRISLQKNVEKQIRFFAVLEGNKDNKLLKWHIYVYENTKNNYINVLDTEWLKIAKKMFYQKAYWKKVLLDNQWDPVTFSEEKLMYKMNNETYYVISSLFGIWRKNISITWKNKQIKFASFVKKNTKNALLKNHIFISASYWRSNNILDKEWLKIAKTMFYKKCYWENIILDNNWDLIKFDAGKQKQEIDGKIYYWVNSNWGIWRKAININNKVTHFANFLESIESSEELKGNIFATKPWTIILNIKWLETAVDLWIKKYPKSENNIKTRLFELSLVNREWEYKEVIHIPKVPELPEITLRLWKQIIFDTDHRTYKVDNEVYTGIMTRFGVWQIRAKNKSWQIVRFATFVEKNKYSKLLEWNIFVTKSGPHAVNVLNQKWLIIAKTMFYQKFYGKEILIDQNWDLLSFTKKKQSYKIGEKVYYWVNSWWWIGKKKWKLNRSNSINFYSFLKEKINLRLIDQMDIFMSKSKQTLILSKGWLKTAVDLWSKEDKRNRDIMKKELVRLGLVDYWKYKTLRQIKKYLLEEFEYKLDSSFYKDLISRDFEITVPERLEQLKDYWLDKSHFAFDTILEPFLYISDKKFNEVMTIISSLSVDLLMIDPKLTKYTMDVFIFQIMFSLDKKSNNFVWNRNDIWTTINFNQINYLSKLSYTTEKSVRYALLLKTYENQTKWKWNPSDLDFEFQYPNHNSIWELINKKYDGKMDEFIEAIWTLQKELNAWKDISMDILLDSVPTEQSYEEIKNILVDKKILPDNIDIWAIVKDIFVADDIDIVKNIYNAKKLWIQESDIKRVLWLTLDKYVSGDLALLVKRMWTESLIKAIKILSENDVVKAVSMLRKISFLSKKNLTIGDIIIKRRKNLFEKIDNLEELAFAFRIQDQLDLDNPNNIDLDWIKKMIKAVWLAENLISFLVTGATVEQVLEIDKYRLEGSSKFNLYLANKYEIAPDIIVKSIAEWPKSMELFEILLKNNYPLEKLKNLKFFEKHNQRFINKIIENKDLLDDKTLTNIIELATDLDVRYTFDNITYEKIIFIIEIKKIMEDMNTSLLDVNSVGIAKLVKKVWITQNVITLIKLWATPREIINSTKKREYTDIGSNRKRNILSSVNKECFDIAKKYNKPLEWILETIKDRPTSPELMTFLIDKQFPTKFRYIIKRRCEHKIRPTSLDNLKLVIKYWKSHKWIVENIVFWPTSYNMLEYMLESNITNFQQLYNEKRSILMYDVNINEVELLDNNMTIYAHKYRSINKFNQPFF